MSRIGKNPVPLPKGVDVTLSEGSVAIKGPLGTLSHALTGQVKVERTGDTLTCSTVIDMANSDAMSGTVRALMANMVTGVTKGFEKKLLFSFK